MTETTTEQVDLEAIKQVQQQVWSAGDFALVAAATTIVGEELCEALDVLPGERALDVACGSGNGALALARRTREVVVGVDYVPELLEQGRRGAQAERLEIEWVEGDAENLPFEDASFDLVTSIFGVASRISRATGATSTSASARSSTGSSSSAPTSDR